MSTKVILTDFDGVLRIWPENNHHIEQRCSLPPDALHAIAFDPQYLQPAIEGKISDAAWRGKIASALKKSYPDADVNSAVAEWTSITGVIDYQVLELLSVYAQHRLVLVTNATSRLQFDLRVHQLQNSFKQIFNSSEMGICKPDSGFYTNVLRHLSISAEEALYIDDSKSNTQAARQLGVESHLFTDISNLREFLFTQFLH